MAFALAIAAVVLGRYIRSKERLISSAPPEQRAELVERALEFFDVDTTTLTRNQKYQLAVQQIEKRSERFRLSALVTVILGAVLATVAIISILTNHEVGETAKLPTRSAQFKVAGFDNGKDEPDSSLSIDFVIVNKGQEIFNLKSVQAMLWGEPMQDCKSPANLGRNVPSRVTELFTIAIDISDERLQSCRSNSQPFSSNLDVELNFVGPKGEISTQRIAIAHLMLETNSPPHVVPIEDGYVQLEWR